MLNLIFAFPFEKQSQIIEFIQQKVSQDSPFNLQVALMGTSKQTLNTEQLATFQNLKPNQFQLLISLDPMQSLHELLTQADTEATETTVIVDHAFEWAESIMGPYNWIGHDIMKLHNASIEII
ncbi:hypothetical protein ACJQWY_04995 [Weissella kandleri]|uniref:hypothetical protein n=1 Tax=Weissella kandleri TaxID=1616 RepID=UPI00387E2543